MTLEIVRDRREVLLGWSSAALGGTLGAFAAYPTVSVRGPLLSTVAPALAVTFAIVVGARASRGLHEQPPPNPVLRAALARSRFLGALRPLALLVLTFGLILVPLGGSVPIAALLGVCAALFGLALVHLSVAFAVGMGTDRWPLAVLTAGGVALTGYGVHATVSQSGVLAPVRLLSPWHWYFGPNPLQFSPAAVIVPVVVATLIFTVAALDYRRGDLR